MVAGILTTTQRVNSNLQGMVGHLGKMKLQNLLEKVKCEW